MKKWNRIIIGLILLAIVGFIGWSVIAAGRQNNTQKVTAAKVTQQNITATITTTGTVTATRTANLTGSGLVTAVNVKVGDKVSAGQILTTYNQTTNLTAPFGGTVTAVNIASGQADTAQATGKAAITVADLSDLRVQLNLTKSEAAQVKVQQAVHMTYLNHTYTGDVAEVDPTATTTTSATGASTPTLGAQVAFDRQPQGLVPGFDIDVTITVDQANNAVTIPQEAITYDRNNQPLVYRIVKGKARRTTVTTGLQSATRIAATKGLRPGETVVLSPSNQLHDGSAVTTQ